MAKKKATKSKVTRSSSHRHFRPSYSAHPVVHMSTVILIVVLLALILSYIVFGMQNPELFK